MSACMAACVHTDMPAGHLVEHLGCTLRLTAAVGAQGWAGWGLTDCWHGPNDGGALAMATQP